ncbi:hypothetical protein LH47_01385 [Anoxybacillus thermarum]|uniref:Uncharacterized protein n=1 Tax=Anoxybacillus thermarum TaxID=404937 RepID=A0A0D0RSB3_9BACL|nr:hypothetical protein [Anoxybacillus thermarum]KIQ94507.1 hypothetical protein LH47_01385 [Anoxybacillus thermarum]
MSGSGVLTKICTREELSYFINLLYRYEVFTYIETIEQRPYIHRIVEIPQSFLSMRIFGELFELHVKPSSNENEYRIVFITDCTDLIEGEYFSLTKDGQRSFFLDKRIIGPNRKLLIQYYKSESYGQFMRWKGVVLSE